MEQNTWILADIVRNHFSIPITTTTIPSAVQGVNPSVLGTTDTSGAAKPWPKHFKGQDVHLSLRRFTPTLQTDCPSRV